MNLVVIVPTSNRPKSIDNFLLNCASDTKWLGIDVIIYDSSDDNKTEVITKNFRMDGYDNIYYDKYIYDGEFSIDKKVISAYEKYANSYKYIWLCRDGFIITFSYFYNDLLYYINNKFNFVVVDSSFRNENKKISKEYKNCKIFFKENSSRLTLLGSLIFSSDTIKDIIKICPISIKNESLWLMSAPLHYYSMKDMKVGLYIGNVFVYNIMATANSFWNVSGDGFKIWVGRWYDVINFLPEIYDNLKLNALKIEMYDFHPFYLMSLIRMRAHGGINIKIINKYKDKIPSVSNTSLKKFYFAAIIPKTIAKLMIDNYDSKFMIIIRRIYDCLNKFYNKFNI